MNKLVFFFLAIISFTSCNKQDVLELKIISTNIQCGGFDKGIRETPSLLDSFSQYSYDIIKFSITNNSSKTIVYAPYHEKAFYIDNIKSYDGLSLRNTVIKNQDNIILKVYSRNSESLPTDKYEFIKVYDSLVLSYYKKLDYHNYFGLRNYFLSSNISIIPPKSTIFYESYISLPSRKNPPFYSQSDYYYLEKEKMYNMSLKFISDSLYIKKDLTKSQLKTIKENNYKIYHGTLESINSIPIKFYK